MFKTFLALSWPARILSILKYGSILAVITFLVYSVVSSYTLREEIGKLKSELSEATGQSERIIRQVEENRERFNRLNEETRIIWEELSQYLEIDDENEYWNSLFDRLYKLGRDENASIYERDENDE